MDKSQEKAAETNEKRKGPFPAVPTTKGQLPLGEAKLMEFDFIELGPLTPLHLLLSEGWATPSRSSRS
jgi:hypothetical protein